jgi:hypothetical protein
MRSAWGALGLAWKHPGVPLIDRGPLVHIHISRENVG